MLSNDLIRLRACEPEDVGILYGWENDTSLWNCGAIIAPYSRKQIQNYVENYDGNIFSAHQLRLMITLHESGEVIGVIDLYDCDPINERCAVGVLIDAPHRGMGFGGMALNLVSDYCRRHLGLHQLYCTIGEDNEASRRLFAASGFSISGRLRSWLRRGRCYRDGYIYQKMLDKDEG